MNTKQSGIRLGFGNLFRQIAILWLVCGAVHPALAWLKDAPAETETILEVKLREGLVLSPGLITYSGADPLFPLAELSEALGFKFETTKDDAGNLRIAGFYIQERNRFEFKSATCEVKSAHQPEEKSSACDAGVLAGEDVYLPKSALEKWFPIRFDIDPYQSVAWIDAHEKLPAQLREERARASVFNPEDALAVTTEEAVIASPPWSGPALDSSLEWKLSKNPGSTTQELGGKFFQSSQILGWDQSLGMLLRDGSFGNLRYRVGKKSLHSDLAGPLRASQVNFLHHDSPSAPLLSGGGETLGASISSYALTTSSNYSSRDFTGTLPTGWEVELYQNEILIQRATSSSDNRYAFKDIPIYYGENEFKLVFYGPFGEQRVERVNYAISQDQVKPGEFAYQLSAGRALIREEIRDPGFYGDFSYGISPLFSGRMAVQSAALRDQAYARRYLMLEGVGKFPNLLVSTHLAATPPAAGFSSGRAADLDIKLPISRINIGVKATRLDQFESNAFLRKNDSFQKDQLESEVSLPFPFLPMISTAVVYRRKRFVDDYLNTQLVRNRLSTSVAGLYVGHDAQIEWNSSETQYEGQFTVQRFSGGTSVRAGLDYRRDSLNKADAEVGTPFSDSLYFTQLAAYQFTDQSVTLASTLAKKYPFGAVNAFASWNSLKTYEMGLGFQSNLLWDKSEKRVYIDADSQASTGHLRITAFFDENRNGQRDEVEATLPGIKFVLNKTELESATDARGSLLIRGLTPYQWNSIGIKPESLPDPAQKPRAEELRIFVRPGAISELDYPILATGTVDGAVRVWQDKKIVPNKRLTLTLIPLGVAQDQAESLRKSGKIDRDGLFWFEDLAPGSYLMRIDPDADSNRIFKIRDVNPKERIIAVPRLGGFVSGMDFDVTLQK